MSIIDSLNDCIRSGYKKNITTNSFELDEESKAAKCKKARFKISGGRVLAYKFDKKITISVKRQRRTIESPFEYFNDVAGVKAMADYILFYENIKNEFYIIVCNIKSSNKHNCKHQIDAGVYFSEYLTKIVASANNINIKLGYVRKVVFSEKYLYKVNYKDLRNKKKNKETLWNYQSNDEKVDTCDLDILCN